MKAMILIIAIATLTGCGSGNHIPNTLYKQFNILCRPHGGLHNIKQIGYGKFNAVCADGHNIHGIVQ